MGSQTVAAPVRVSDVLPGWGVTPERVDEAVRRIVQACNPLRVVAFGSWARGEAGLDSDLDLAVFLDEASDLEASRHLHAVLWGVDMSVDILTFNEERHHAARVSQNSIHYYIEKDGAVLYERRA